MTRSPDDPMYVLSLTASLPDISLNIVGRTNCGEMKTMSTQRDEVVFLGEVSCPEPYEGRRVPMYRVVRGDHPMYGRVITEQEVLQEGLFHRGLAAGLFPRVVEIGKN